MSSWDAMDIHDLMNFGSTKKVGGIVHNLVLAGRVVVFLWWPKLQGNMTLDLPNYHYVTDNHIRIGNQHKWLLTYYGHWTRGWKTFQGVLQGDLWHGSLMLLEVPWDCQTSCQGFVESQWRQFPREDGGGSKGNVQLLEGDVDKEHIDTIHILEYTA